MQPLLFATLVFIAGYITARFSLITQAVELANFAWEHGVVGRATKEFLILSIFFFLFCLPIERIVTRETNKNTRVGSISAREQLRRRGSF